MSDTMPDLDAIEARAKTAHDEVSRLCCGNDRGWRMSIPADDARDSDLIISAALNDVEDLVAYARTLEAEVEHHRAEAQHHRTAHASGIVRLSEWIERAEAAEAERDRLAQRLNQVRAVHDDWSNRPLGSNAWPYVHHWLRDLRAALDGDQRTEQP